MNVEKFERMLKDKKFLKKILNKLMHLKRTAWLPIVEEGDGERTDSKISGIPWLSKDEDWPICPGCKQEMQFFLQINLDSIPPELKNRYGTGILQMFHCIDPYGFCKIKDRSWFFSESHLIRIIKPIGEPKDVGIPDSQRRFPPKKVVDWEAKDDYPSDADHDWFPDINLSWDESNAYFVYPLRGEKLGGYPAWVQVSGYPKCPACQKKMLFVFQVGSNRLIPYNIPDGGKGWIFQCPNHQDIVAYHYQGT